MPRAFVFGYFGAGNFGDEWTLASFLEGCQEIGFNPRDFVVLTRAPHRTATEHSVPTVPRNWHAILSSIKGCQVTIGCGGSLLQDATSFRSLAFYCSLIGLSKVMGKKVALLGQGLGPLKRASSRKLAKWALNSCDLVTFRDKVSLKVAERLGARTENCSVTADLTFVWKDLPKPERKAEIGVNLRPVRERWDNAAVLKVIENELRKGKRVLLLPLQPNFDELALKPLASPPRTDWWQYKIWSDGLEGIARVRLLIAMRLHALIAACLLGIPFVGLGYDPKVANVLGNFAAEYILPLSVKGAELVGALEQILESAAVKLNRFQEFVAAQRSEAKRNFELLASKLLT